jgi:hypothetical protein
MINVKFKECKIGKYQQNSTVIAIDDQNKSYSWGSNSLG